MVLFGADKDIILDTTNFNVIQRIFQWFYTVITWTSTKLWSIGPLVTDFSVILIKIRFTHENASKMSPENMCYCSWLKVSLGNQGTTLLAD